MKKNIIQINQCKRHISILLAVVMIATLFVVAPIADKSAQAYAAGSGVEKLAKGKTYTSTLQGSDQHTISWDCKYNESTNTLDTSFYIDGKETVITTKKFDVVDPADFGYQVSVVLASVSADTKLICLELTAPTNGYLVSLPVYRYVAETKTLNLVGDAVKINPFKGDICVGDSLYKAAKNKLYFRWINPHAHSTGIISFNAVFNYSGGKVKGVTTAKITSPKKKLTAQKDFTCYKTAGGKKVSFTVKKGDKASMIQIKKYKSNRYYIQIKKGSKKGWVKASYSTSSLLFKGTGFAA